MNLSAPIEDVIPGHRAAVLAALLRLKQPVTGRELAAQAAVPVATTARIIEDLVDAGLVDPRPAGRAFGVTLNRQHLAVPALELLVGMRRRLIDLLRSTICEWSAPAAAAWIFGSAALGTGDRRSDIDLVVVARREPAAAWERQIGELSDLVPASTGNTLQLLSYSRQRFRKLVESENPLIRSLRMEGIELVDGSVALLKPL